MKGHLYISSYADEPADTAEFILDRACLADLNVGHTGNNERYLVQPKESMYWEILVIDEKSSELSCTAKGNLLIYRKAKSYRLA